MKKALVTGADGFIGSHLTEMLLKRGYNVRALTFYNSFNSLGWLEDLSDPSLEIISGDIRDSNLCRQLVQDIDVIFHLAALIAIPYSYRAPESFIQTNVLGTLNICQAAREKSVERILVTSTSEVYGTAQYVPIDEKHPKQPQSPYSASKIAADSVALSFFYSYGLPVTIVRPFNTYGPRQSARAVIPTIITQLLSGNQSINIGDLTPTRDFNFVKDICRGFIEIAGCDSAIGEELNICSGTEYSIQEILNIISGIIGIEARALKATERFRPPKSEVYRLNGDNSKLRSLTGYIPKFSVDDGLKETINWFRIEKNLKLYKSDKYNV